MHSATAWLHPLGVRTASTADAAAHGTALAMAALVATAEVGANTVLAALTFATIVVNVVVQPIMGEWRTTRQRKWIEQQGREQEARTHAKLKEIDHQVRNVGETAAAAYEVANHVNEWRGEMMSSIKGGQDRIIEQQTQIAAKVDEQLQRPDMPALVILPAPPAEVSK